MDCVLFPSKSFGSIQQHQITDSLSIDHKTTTDV